MHRVYIIERNEHGWFVVCSVHSRIYRYTVRLFGRFICCESARIGGDTGFVRIARCSSVLDAVG